VSKLKLILCMFGVTLAACAGLKVATPETYRPRGEAAEIAVESVEMRDFAYIPLMNDRNIVVEVYDDKNGCPDINAVDKGQLYQFEVSKDKWQLPIRIPTDASSYFYIQNTWSSGGTKTTFSCAFKLSPKVGEKYKLVLGIQKAGFSMKDKCPYLVYQMTDKGLENPSSFKSLNVNESTFDRALGSGSCDV